MIGSTSAQNNTGIGIQKIGQLYAAIGETIEYQVTIFNLGEYWIRNITVADILPDGTSKAWTTPDLAPHGLVGDSFNITHILYTVQEKDFLYTSTGSPYVVNHAEIVGYAEVQELGLLVSAETNFPTFILIVPVGGYTVDIKTREAPNPISVHILILFLALEFFKASDWLREYGIVQSLVRRRRRILSASAKRRISHDPHGEEF